MPNRFCKRRHADNLPMAVYGKIEGQTLTPSRLFIYYQPDAFIHYDQLLFCNFFKVVSESIQ
jgi:hypothetical protein